MLLARLGATWGTEGYIKASSESGDLGHLLVLREVLVGFAQKEARSLRVDKVLIKGDKVLFKFEGFDSPERSRDLTGCFLWADCSFATPLGEGEYYLSELEGWLVVGGDGEKLGKILSIFYGARFPLLEVQAVDGKNFLVPLAPPFVLRHEVDLRQLVVDKDLLL